VLEHSEPTGVLGPEGPRSVQRLQVGQIS
jgi:hypothetical protein